MPLSRAGVVGARGGCECAPCYRLLAGWCLSLEDYVTGIGVIRVMDDGVLLLPRIQEEYRRWPVRMLLVPATTRLLSRWKWWAPARLTRWCLPPARGLGRLELDGAPAPGTRQRPAQPSQTP